MSRRSREHQDPLHYCPKEVSFEYKSHLLGLTLSSRKYLGISRGRREGEGRGSILSEFKGQISTSRGVTVQNYVEPTFLIPLEFYSPDPSLGHAHLGLADER